MRQTGIEKPPTVLMWPQQLFMVSAGGNIALIFCNKTNLNFYWCPKADPKNFLAWLDEPIQGLQFGSRNSKFEDAAKDQN